MNIVLSGLKGDIPVAGGIVPSHVSSAWIGRIGREIVDRKGKGVKPGFERSGN
jgi:hypothetical protein